MKRLKYIIARILPDKYRLRLPWVRRAYANLPPFEFIIPPDAVRNLNDTTNLLLQLQLMRDGYMNAGEFADILNRGKKSS